MRASLRSTRRTWGRPVIAAADVLAQSEARLARSRKTRDRLLLSLRRDVSSLEAENDLLRARS